MFGAAKIQKKISLSGHRHQQKTAREIPHTAGLPFGRTTQLSLIVRPPAASCEKRAATAAAKSERTNMQLAKIGYILMLPMFDACVRAWLVILALVELPGIVTLLAFDAALDGFASNLANQRAEKHVWAFMLALLAAARVLGAVGWQHRAVRYHCAVVHVLEACCLGCEYVMHGSGGDSVVHAIIHANAVLFVVWAAACKREKAE